MARFDTQGLNELLVELAYYDMQTGPTADRMLLAGAEVVKDAWKQEATRRKFCDTGAMINSIGYPRAVKSAADIRSVDIYPQGADKRGTRNAEKAFVLHWGTQSAASVKRRKKKGKKFSGPGIPATHWVDDADRLSGPGVMEAYTRIWDEFLGGKK